MSVKRVVAKKRNCSGWDSAFQWYSQTLYRVNVLVITVTYWNGSINVLYHVLEYSDTIRLRIEMWKSLCLLEIVKTLHKLHATTHTNVCFDFTMHATVSKG